MRRADAGTFWWTGVQYFGDFGPAEWPENRYNNIVRVMKMCDLSSIIYNSIQNGLWIITQQSLLRSSL